MLPKYVRNDNAYDFLAKKTYFCFSISYTFLYMAKYSFWGILFFSCVLSVHAQLFRVTQEKYLNYYHLPTNSYLLKDTLYQYGTDFQEGIAIVRKNEKYGAIDSTGKEIIALRYDMLTPFSQSQAIFTVEYLKGVVSTKGREIIAAKYDYLGDISEGKRVAMIDGKWGFIDLKGTVVVPFIYEYVSDFQEGRAMFLQDEKCGFLNQKGQVVIDANYEWVANMHEGKAAVMQNGQYGFIDSLGKTIIPLQYDLAWDFSEGLAAVKIATNASIAFINTNGKTVVPAKYEDFYNFSENVAAVKLTATHKWGFLRKDGSALTDFIFEEAKQMKEGRAAVKKEGKWGYLDENGKEIIACQYAQAFDFEYDYAIVGTGAAYTELGRKEPAISASGIVPVQFRQINMYKFGYINKVGEMIIAPKYQNIRRISSHFVWVEKDARNGTYFHLSNLFSIESGCLYIEPGAVYKDFLEPKIASTSVLKNKNGELVSDKRFVVNEIYSKEACFSLKDNKLYDSKGKKMFMQEYESAYPIDENFFRLYNKENKMIQVDINEHQINTDTYQLVAPLGEKHYVAAYRFSDTLNYFIVDEKGRQVGDVGFQDIKMLEKSLFICKKNGKWGLYNGNGFLLIPCKYDEISGYQNDMAVVVKDSVRGYASKTDFFSVATLKEMPQNHLSLFNENLAPFYQNGKYGFVNKSNKIVISCEYEMVWGFRKGLAKVKKDKKLGYINPKNEIIIPIEYDELSTFSEGLIISKKNGKIGFLNEKNEIIIPFIYQDAFPFKDSLAIVQSGVNQKWGCIDRQGNVKVLFNYDEISSFSEGYARVVFEGKEGIIDKNNVLIKDCIFDKVGKIKNGVAIISYKGRFGLINMNGQFIISPIYEEITRLKGDTFLCKSASFSGFYTKSNQAILPIQYETEKTFIRNAYYALSKQGKRIIFDKYGRKIRQVEGDFEPISDKYFTEAHSKPVVYDNKGNQVIPGMYQSIDYMKNANDLFLVKNDAGMYGVINLENKTLLPFVYQHIKPLHHTMFMVSGDSLSAVVDSENGTILPPIYQSIETVSEVKDIFIVKLRGKTGVVNAQNKTIIPFSYCNIYKPYGDNKNYFISRDANGKETLYTFDGKKLTIPPFTEVYLSDNEELILVKNYSLSGLYHIDGTEIYPMRSDEIFTSHLNDAFIPIRKGKKWGMIDRKGHIVALFEYDYLKLIATKDKNLFIFQQGNKMGIMDEQWNILYENTVEILYDATLDLFYIGMGKNIQYIDKNGKEVQK